MNSLLTWWVDRPLIVNLTMVLILVLGWFSLETGAIKGPPDMVSGSFSITTARPGASAEKMELSVTVPLEDELRSVDGIQKFRSNSAEGLSMIQVDADPDASDEALADLAKDLQRAIDRTVSRLPSDLPAKPLLIQAKSVDYPITVIMLYGDMPMETLRRLALKLQSQLREIPGVRGVNRLGYPDREVNISLDPLKLNRLGVSFGEIETAIKSRNVTETGGSLASFVGEQDVVAVGEFSEPMEVADVIVRSDGAGNYLRVRDLAEVNMGFSDPTVWYTKDKQRGLMLTVRAQAESNDLDLSRRIHVIIEDFRATLPANANVRIIEDGTDMTRTMIGTLLNNALLGGVLITLVLLFFFPWRATVWVVVGIPVAILFGMALMPMFGITYNSVAWVAMVLMLGLLVDDAIVTSESIYRKFEEGLSPRDAGTQGVAAIARPVITGALTTVIAMSPLLLIGGVDAKFMWVIPATVVLIIIASLIECLFLLPSHIAESLRRAKAGREKAAWFKHVENFYLTTLDPLLASPWRALGGGLVVAMLAMLVVSKFLAVESYPDTDANKIIINIELPPGSPLEDTVAVLDRMQKRILAVLPPEIVTGYFGVAGETGSANFDDMIQVKSVNLGKFELSIVTGEYRDLSARQIADKLQALDKEFPELRKFQADVNNDQPDTGAPVELRVVSLDDRARGLVADDILAWLRRHPHTRNVSTSYSPGKSVIQLQLDYEKMAEIGVAVADVTRALRIAYDGLRVEELQTVEERIRYRLRLQDQYRTDVNALRSLVILNKAGEQVPLRNIADFRVEQGQSVISHFGGSRTETITADINRTAVTLAGIDSELRAWIEKQGFEQRYPGLHLDFAGELKAQAETAERMGAGLILVVVGIFFLMVLLFNSLSQPLIVMAVIPLAFIAVLLALTVHGFILGVSAMVGFLGLAGVLVNSSLVLVDYVNKLHSARRECEPGVGDRPAMQDIREGARSRLRPILITALTTGAGLGPAAYGLAGAHPSQTPMIMVMFWGGIVGAIVTLYTVPLLLAINSRDKAAPVAAVA